MNQIFSVERGGVLLRRVSPRRGRPYVHSCSLRDFEIIAHCVEEAKEPFRMEDIHAAAAAEQVPWTPIATALAFLADRGLLERVHGRRFGTGSMDSNDAMIAFHFLAHQCN